MEKNKRSRFIIFLDKLDDKFEKKGKLFKNIWQLFKFGIVSILITIFQLAILYSMYYLMKGWKDPLPRFLAKIFSPETVGENHANWGYVLPFFLSNFIANTLGYFINRSRTFKSDAPMWHYIVYIAVLIVLVLFSTWFQGVLNNVFIKWDLEAIGPFFAMNIACFVQFLVLYPLQKFVLLKEKKIAKEEQKIR